jgi:hypothetical protein
LKRRKEKSKAANRRHSMRWIEKEISKGNVIDLLGQFFYQLGIVKDSELITDIEITGKDTFFVRLKIEKELEVKLIEHNGKRLQEGSSMGGQTGTGETP